MNNNEVVNTRMMMQPSKSLVQSDWGDAVGNVYTLPNICKGAELAAAGTTGVLEVHLIEDPATKWYLMPLTSGNRNGGIFDKIRTTNSTVTLSAVTCFSV
jgi:hypothetical protein